jgi:hypothetical protein
MAVLGGAGHSPAAAQLAASAAARRSGRTVQVPALTTDTTTVTAQPGGDFMLREYTLPVRVRQGQRWVRVNTRLAGTRAGLAALAVPDDAVTFSPGGAGPVAVISADGGSLALRWPGELPVPSVSGSSATYRNVLPGVDLVLTAISSVSGGFSEVLVIRSAAAARDRRLARVTLAVSAAGTRLAMAAGGGLRAAVPGRGSFAAPAPRMWDSSRMARGASAVRATAAAARAAGASIAPVWAGTASSVAGPGGGARVAPVTARVAHAGGELSLIPDTRLLAAPGTRFPVYIDPTFNWYPADGYEQAFDPVQSDCPSSHYNDKADYPDTPVGYNNFNEPNEKCDVGSTDYSYYRVGVPSVISGAGVHLHTASLQADEAYSSDCTSTAAVTLTWTGAIGSGTGWNNKPGPTADNSNITVNVGPDYTNSTTYSCNTQYVTGDKLLVAAPFNVLSDLNALRGKASTFTFRLWENGNTDEDEHKQFTDNPELEVSYADTPLVPGKLKATATSDGTGSVGCDTSYAGGSSPLPPPMGKSASVHGPYLWATYSTDDADTLTGTVAYWQYSKPSNTGTITVGSDLETGGTPAAAEMPATFTSGMANGTVIAWHAEASNGTYTSAWSPTCYFTVYPTDPDPPTLTAGFSQTTAQPMNSSLTFTITQAGTDTDAAKEFVWGLDQPPPTSGTIPAAQTCTTTAATSSCTKITSGSATLTISVRSPGPHELWVYELDTASNESGMTTGAPAGQTSTFLGAGDAQTVYNSGSSLAANFTAAVTAGGNSMISSSAPANCGASSGDGSGDDLDAADLAADGWASGGDVTVDGADFQLPAFGSCAKDNLLAANQQIGTGTAHGSALVFLATSTGADSQVPGLATGSPDSGELTSDETAPSVAGGTPVTGSGCTSAVAFDITETGCVPASGTINYASGCPAGQQAAYDLTVPDWVAGPSDIAAVSVADRVGPSGTVAGAARIYAFAVPIDPACTVTWVDLPDVGNAVSAQVAGSGSSTVVQSLPGLHIFGMAFRNTTTATPELNGSLAASPAGQAWTGAFESPIEDGFLERSQGDQTIRIGLSPNIGAPAGAQVRIRLTEPGFLSGDGIGPLQIGAATIAPAWGGAIPTQQPVPLTFGGHASAVVPEGGDVYSDPLTLPFSISAGQEVLVSLWIENPSLPALPENSFASGAVTWFAPPTVANETEDQSGTPFTGTGSYWIGAVPVVTGLDVTTPATTLTTSMGSQAVPGTPTVVVAGDNIIDGWTSQAIGDSLNFPSQRLAGQLTSAGLASGYSVVDAGVEANQLLSDGTSTGGVSLLARLDRDILAEPDVGTVIINEGLEDLLMSASGTTSGSSDLVEGNVSNALQTLELQLNAFGINVIVTTLTPCAGYSDATAGDFCTTGAGTTVDAIRQDLNSGISDSLVPGFPGLAGICPADFDASVSNGASPEALPSADNAGDDVNLTLSGSASGYAALAQAVSGGFGACGPLPPAIPFPATS